MKYILSIVFISLQIHNSVSAQTGNPKTKAEVEARQKQLQQELDKLTPEQKKMMEQMGMTPKVPSMSAGTTDADVKSAVSGGPGVPSKNAGLIAAIPKITITDANLAAYLTDVNKYIAGHLSNEGKTAGEYLYKGLKSAGFDHLSIANNAAGLWINGEPEPAVYISGRAAADDAKNTDNLSNLAAMLSMAGAPHMAIPLLDFLSKKFPGNTTILNNLGQAWFYLGETGKADTYLQQTIKAFAWHPQANQTQCLIQQSKGNTPKAIEHMKNSLAYSFSLHKINTLRKLGYSVTGKDMRKPFHPDPNPLGLREFIRPDYPKNYEEEVQLKYVWDNFQKEILTKTEQLNRQLQPLMNGKMQQAQQTYNTISKNGVAGLSANNAAQGKLYEKTAQRYLDDMKKDGGQAYLLKIAKKKTDDLIKKYQAEKENAHKNIEKQLSIRAGEESELGKKGEDLGADICNVNRAYALWLYKNYNEALQQAYTDYLHLLRLKLEEELYWKQLSQDDNEFAATQINAKKEWLAALSNSRFLESAYITPNNICRAPAPDQGKKAKLADFEDMNCKYHTSLNFGGGNSIETHCSKMTVKFNGGPLSGNLNYRSDNSGRDRLVNGNLEAVMERSVGAGPVQAGAKAGMGVEFTSSGIEDVYVNAEASAMNVAASGKMSLISGSMSGGISGFGK